MTHIHTETSMNVTGNQTISFEVKSQLAKLLATENITTMHNPAAKTASFDTGKRLLVLPVWQNISEDLYDMLVVHEVGHALYTCPDKWIDAIKNISKSIYPDIDSMETNKSTSIALKIKNYLNVVEDARIDKLQKRRYPGSKKNYSIGYKELHDKDFFGLLNKDINGMSLIDRLNIYFKSTGIFIKFTPEERKFVFRMENAETFEDVASITEDLYAFARDEKLNQQKEKSDDPDDVDDAESEGSDVLDEYSEYDLDDDDSDEDKDEKESTSKNSKSKNNEKNDEDQDIVPNSETQEASEKSMSKIIKDEDVNYVYFDIPTFNYSVILDDYPVVLQQMEKEFSYFDDKESLITGRKEWQQKENDTISFMVKEFEMRKSADAYARIATAKTGVIDTNKLVKYKFAEDIFKKVTIVPKGKNHGFVMFLDWSGSMIIDIQNTLKQLFSLTMFCKRVNIPFEVYLFRTNTGYVKNTTDVPNKNLINFNNSGFKIRNILSSRMDLNTLNKAYNFLWASGKKQFICDVMHSTPLNQTILAAHKIVNDFREKNKLQIVNTIFLTDGCSDYTGLSTSNMKLQWKKGGNKYIVNDKMTKKTYWVDNNNSYSVTSTYLRILKDRTNSNIIGFFLFNYHNLSSLVKTGIISESVIQNKDVIQSWKNNDFVGVESAGYDEYYIIRSRSNKKPNDLTVNSTMTKNAITRNFMKFSERKSINRVMLSKFMERVSTTSY